MTMPPIDKGVPIPNRFPFAQMQVGDSFVMPTTVSRSILSVYARRYGDKHNMKFTTRQMPDGAIRCWRTQ
jgi:hypothetical protein